MAYNKEISIKDLEKTKFSYTIGEVKTNIPWLRPERQRIIHFLQSAQVKPIRKKYHISIIGACLWDMNNTWDVDLVLRPINDYMPSGVNSFLQIEKDMYTLYHTAFNDWKLLLDIAFRVGSHKLPSKEQIESYNKDVNWVDEYTYPTDTPYVYKIGYIKKIVNSSKKETILYDTDKYPENIKVTDFHLTKVKSISTFPTKVIKKIINAVEPHHILSSISVEDFINMDQQRFDKFKNV